MKWGFVSWLLAGVFALVPLLDHARAADATPPLDEKAAERGRKLCALFLERHLDELHGTFGAEMKGVLSLAQLKAFREQVDRELGAMREIVEERTRPVDAPGHPSITEFVRLARFEKRPEVVEMVFGLDASGAVLGFFLRPAKIAYPSPHLDYQTKTPLHLPFDGEWFVFWGGRSVDENQHALARDQRFAMDLVIRRDQKTHAGEGTRNEDYFCFGQSVFAPGPGRVVAVVDTVADNTPGQLNTRDPLGNHVVIDHGNGEFTFLAHFKKKSLHVKVGDVVAPGEVLALCGNSGHSSEPHLHVHLQTTAVFAGGDGLPAQFVDYVTNGTPTPRGEPKRGETIRPRSDRAMR